ncbi:MAG: RecQ family ATP-dependent DNA helicase [Bacteroidales bacterium]|nr:RecQ family ATP-dependent DNA helicase [Bacteroidales bacterium]
MNTIVYIDTEVSLKNKEILDIGGVKENGNSFHSNSISEFISFIDGTEFICGHNILNHDLKHLQKALTSFSIDQFNVIDTLFLSPLLFPMKPYHHLLKDDKLQSDDLNNPLNDSIKARDLFKDEVTAFNELNNSLKSIYYLLLNDKNEFRSFFKYNSFKSDKQIDLRDLIHKEFNNEICSNSKLDDIIATYPIELAYCLSLINCKNRYSITPPWVLKNYPEVERIMFLLRNKPCITGCAFCNKALDHYNGLNHYFGFKSFKTYDGKPLQENAVKAAIENKSILVVFPTGGGKSLTFQLPALMSGENMKGLTVVISPLQSLMKDQVDNLEKINITDAVTINGLLDPIERSKSFERVEDGSAAMLYISPESLRSKTIERLLLGRNIVRFVIDEAHCFSSWGQDFRVDYLYIGDFIKSLQEKKNLQEGIPVSCFTATAKQKVIEDIRDYFKNKLSLNLEIYRSSESRTNLQYKVFENSNDLEKYNRLRELIESKNCPTIVYVSRTREAYSLADALNKDGFNARPYHGKMDVKEKTKNQNAFISGDVQIMVATSAFGMGVDKKDIGMVIHYEISDSLENYVQEAGRAGRDENIIADCYVLYNEDDLGKHFTLLNQTKLSIKEIKQVWKAIKEITKLRSTVSNSSLEIARKAGWDEGITEIETRVTTAISALEEAGYLKRGQNVPRIYANSILTKNAQEAIDKINSSERFDEQQKIKAIRIIKKLISSKSKKQSNEEVAESRIDYISDHLGIVKEEVIRIITLLREEKILADTKDLTAFIKIGDSINHSKSITETFQLIEDFLLQHLEEQEKIYHIKELNEKVFEAGCQEATPNKLKTIINFWAIKNWIKRKNQESSKNHVIITCAQPKAILQEKLLKRHALAKFIVEFLYEKIDNNTDANAEEVLIEFSVIELKEAYEKSLELFKFELTTDDIEDTLFYLSRIDAIKIEGGFLVVYNKMTIEKLEKNNKAQYKKEDYQKLDQFYQNKVQQIHIVGEYAKKMVEDYRGALQFVEDYFKLNYPVFLNKYFKGSRLDDIKRNLTPAKFRQLFGSLSTSQLAIINDKESKYIVIAAGPGSGKTRVLVHKLASLLLMEDIKHEQLLMLTFSRAAATEFKKRLIELYGNAANFIEIKTFHSYCFDLLGKVGSLEKSDEILKTTIEKIQKHEVEQSRISKMVLVIDEAQDMDIDEYNLINALIEENEDMRVLAVGDDDQNIFTFRGADSIYMEKFITEKKAKKYELLENFRSKVNLVTFSNEFVKTIYHRLKALPIVAFDKENGVIKIVKYDGDNLIVPTVKDIVSTDLSGSTCVLTQTNKEALNITGLLIKNGFKAKLIQTNDGFNLYNLLEVRFFLGLLKSMDDSPTISDENWARSKTQLYKRFINSSKLNICKNIISDFESTNTRIKYFSDLEVFIRESKLEDFIGEDGETIFVSTIHKAKGKEFDNVFIMLENCDLSSDEKKRPLYVAITRAKQNLFIHHNSNFFDNFQVEGLVSIVESKRYLPPDKISVQLSFTDVNLGFFEYRQSQINRLIPGNNLDIGNDGCENSNGDIVLKFSKKFQDMITQLNEQGYQLKYAIINFIIFWKDSEKDKEFKIILPELDFER